MKEKEEVQITGSGFRRKQMKGMGGEEKSRAAPIVPKRPKPAPKNDDLDDLDDMMGGDMGGGFGGGFGRNDDEDDFFGGGGKKFDDDDDFMSGKKKKSDNSDPLAFLQRAKDEKKNKADLTSSAEDILLARERHFPATIADLYDPEKMPKNLRKAHDNNDEIIERIYIGRRFKNNTERLEKLFELYTKITSPNNKTNMEKAS